MAEGITSWDADHRHTFAVNVINGRLQGTTSTDDGHSHTINEPFMNRGQYVTSLDTGTVSVRHKHTIFVTSILTGSLG